MSEPTLAQTLQIVVDAFVRKRVSSACLVASGIVANRMGRGEVVEGYQIEDSLKGYGVTTGIVSTVLTMTSGLLYAVV